VRNIIAANVTNPILVNTLLTGLNILRKLLMNFSNGLTQFYFQLFLVIFEHLNVVIVDSAGISESPGFLILVIQPSKGFALLKLHETRQEQGNLREYTQYD